MNTENNDAQTARLSIVIPMYNEEDNVLPMAEKLHLALNTAPYPWEVIMVNDGSSDNTEQCMCAAREQYGKHIRMVRPPPFKPAWIKRVATSL